MSVCLFVCLFIVGECLFVFSLLVNVCKNVLSPPLLGLIVISNAAGQEVPIVGTQT